MGKPQNQPIKLLVILVAFFLWNGGMKIMKSRLLTVLVCSSLLAACDSSLVTYKETPKYELGKENSGSSPAELITKVQDYLGTNEGPSNSTSTNTVNESESTRKEVVVKSVVDSDTIVYFDPELQKEVTGRLIGINGPESTKEVQTYGPEASEYLKNLLTGRTIEIETDPSADQVDKYGRFLIHAFLGGKSIQALLLAEGLVRVAYLYGDYKYIDLYKEAESIAKESGLNIWSIPGYVDEKNGFNMDVVTDDVKNTLSNTVEDVIEVIEILK